MSELKRKAADEPAGFVAAKSRASPAKALVRGEDSATSVIPEAKLSDGFAFPSKMPHVASFSTFAGCDTISTISKEEPSSPDEVDEEMEKERPLGVIAKKLRAVYSVVLERSLTLPEDQRLVMYDPHDANEIAKKVGPYTVRLDARRAGKPKAAPAPKVVVCTPLDPAKFNFTKIKNADERLLRTTLAGHPYDFLTNKFPLCTCHSLLVSQDLVPQQMAPVHLSAIKELLGGSSFYGARAPGPVLLGAGGGYSRPCRERRVPPLGMWRVRRASVREERPRFGESQRGGKLAP